MPKKASVPQYLLLSPQFRFLKERHVKTLLLSFIYLFSLSLMAGKTENIRITFLNADSEESYMLESEVSELNGLDLFDLNNHEGNLPDKKMNVRAATNMEKEPSIEWVVDTQFGFARVTSNTTQVPNNASATEIDLGEGTVESLRIYISAIVKKKHEIRLLFAPLSYESSQVSDSDILFNGVSFLAGRTTETGYQFNSYRLSYIYHFEPTGKFNYRIGFTGKIRDAYTLVRQDGRESRFDNLGFVPLLHLGVRINLTERIYWDNEVEGSWAPQGYAVDFRSSINYEINERYSIGAGVGYLGGGADVDSVSTFADILFGFVSFKIKF